MIPCLGQVSIFVVEQFIRNGELPITIQCALHVRLALGRQDPLPNKDTIYSWVLNFHEFLPYFYRSRPRCYCIGSFSSMILTFHKKASDRPNDYLITVWDNLVSRYKTKSLQQILLFHELHWDIFQCRTTICQERWPSSCDFWFFSGVHSNL